MTQGNETAQSSTGVSITAEPRCPSCNTPIDLTAEDPACRVCGEDLTAIRQLRELGSRYYNEALALASKGDYDSAYEKLASALQLSGESDTIRVVMGKLLHRKGLHKDAIAHWGKALAANPKNEDAHELVAVARGSLWRRRLTAGVIVVAAFCAFGWVLLAFTHNVAGQASPAVEASPAIEQLSSAAPQKGQEQPAAAMQEQQDVPSAAVRDLARELSALEGVECEVRTDRVHVELVDGVFSLGSDQLNPAGKVKLHELCDAIGARPEPLQVTVIGCTDSQPLSGSSSWGDNWNLGLARAMSAVAHMRNCVEHGHMEWVASSRGEAQPLNPNDSEENMSRNRTVVLQIAFSNHR